MDPDQGFRNLLHSIMEGLTDENVKMIRYLCRDAIPHGREMTSALQFLDYFETKGWINIHDLSFLAEVLYRINRHDLLKKLPGVKNRKDYEANFLMQAQQNFTPYRIACFQLLDEITNAEFGILKNLCRGRLSNRNHNRSTDILSLLVCLEEEDLMSEGDLEFTMTLLQKLDNQEPFKTFQKLRDGDTSYTLPKSQQSYPQFPTSSNLPYGHHSGHITSSQSLPQMQHVQYSKMDYGPVSFAGITGAQQYSTAGEFQRPLPNFSTQSASRAFDGQDCGPQKSRQQLYLPSFGPGSSAFVHDNETSLKQPAEHDDNMTSVSSSRSAQVSTTEAMHVSIQQRDQLSVATQQLQIADEEAMSIVNQVSEVDEQAEDDDVGNGGATNRFGSQETHDQSQPLNFKNDDVYQMERNPCGVCVIINNEKFEENRNEEEVVRRTKLNQTDYQVPNTQFKNREGSQEDVIRLRKLFTSFRFQVFVYENLDKREMQKIIVDKTRMDYTTFDCFVCVIMSHGLEGQIYGVDGMPLPIAHIHKAFTPEKCPSLTNKPKLFFFQACQGDRRMGGHSAPPIADVEADSPQQPLEMIQATPSEADFLVSHSTVPGYLSYRHKKSGSWFISALVENLEKHHETDDVLSILIKVNNEMSSKPFKQMPMPIATLRKKIYFTKKTEASTIAEPAT